MDIDVDLDLTSKNLGHVVEAAKVGRPDIVSATLVIEYDDDSYEIFADKSEAAVMNLFDYILDDY